jgi:hypothetical protein
MPFTMLSQINKFLETNYPQGRAVGVFRSFHFNLKVQKTKFVYYTSPKTAVAVLSSHQGEVKRNSEATPQRILLIKIQQISFDLVNFFVI